MPKKFIQGRLSDKLNIFAGNRKKYIYVRERVKKIKTIYVAIK